MLSLLKIVVAVVLFLIIFGYLAYYAWVGYHEETDEEE